VDGGLATPIVRSESQSLCEIAEEVRTLAERAAKRLLNVSEILGGSFSISNLGGYGVEQFDAINNPPQCAILALGCAKPRMTVSATGEPRIATVLRATMSVDHRAIDGTTCAAFFATLSRKIEQPQGLFGATLD